MPICIVVSIVACLAAFDLQRPVTVSQQVCLLGLVFCQFVIQLSARHVVVTSQSELHNGLDRAELNRRLNGRWSLHQAVWMASCLLAVTCFEWPQIVSQTLGNGIVARLVVLVPILLPVVFSWCQLFEIEQQLEERVRQDGRFPFVWRRIRTQIMVPLMAILFVVVWQDAVELLKPWQVLGAAGPAGEVPFRVLPVLALTLFLPSIIRRTWETERLEDGRRPSLLEERCAELGFHIRDILIWKTGGQLRNAAVTGMVSRWRYILLSDRLLQELGDEQVESIFLHELAHVRKRHHLRLTVWVLLVSVSALLLIRQLIENQVSWAVWLAAILGVCLALSQLGKLAKLFELEADLWAGKLHAEPSDYLEAVARVIPNDNGQDTWLHPSFSRRCEFLLCGSDQATVWLLARLRRTQAFLCCCLFIGAMLGWYLVSMSPYRTMSPYAYPGIGGHGSHTVTNVTPQVVVPR